jgi:ubiquinone/menaquinone biosynthesis C-methylase UbiE
MNTFKKFAELYDHLYFSEQRYSEESELFISLLKKHMSTNNMKLLDLACGTGTHIKYFQSDFQVYGLDNSKSMIKIAQSKYPNVQFFRTKMEKMKFDFKFGAMVCTYGSIGLVKTKSNARKTLKNISNHLEIGGVCILVPWSTKESFVSKIIVDKNQAEDGTKIAKMESVRLSKNQKLVNIEFHYLIGRNNKVEYHRGSHPPVGLFSNRDYEDFITSSKLNLVETIVDERIQMGMAHVCKKL